MLKPQSGSGACLDEEFSDNSCNSESSYDDSSSDQDEPKADQMEGSHTFTTRSYAFASDILQPGQPYNIKIPPSFDGRMTVFRFEEMMKDWEDITTIEKERRGPLVRERLCGEAEGFRMQLDREQCKGEDGVESDPRPELGARGHPQACQWGMHLRAAAPTFWPGHGELRVHTGEGRPRREGRAHLVAFLQYLTADWRPYS